MEAMTSDGVLSLVRMISRVCGRTNRILRSSSTSACPEVFSPVRTRSNALALMKASAATLSRTRSIFQSGRMVATVAAKSGSGPTTRAVRCGSERGSLQRVGFNLDAECLSRPFQQTVNSASASLCARSRNIHYRLHRLLIHRRLETLRVQLGCLRP